MADAELASLLGLWTFDLKLNRQQLLTLVYYGRTLHVEIKKRDIVGEIEVLVSEVFYSYETGCCFLTVKHIPPLCATVDSPPLQAIATALGSTVTGNILVFSQFMYFPSTTQGMAVIDHIGSVPNVRADKIN